jgi:hypothetical protein
MRVLPRRQRIATKSLLSGICWAGHITLALVMVAFVLLATLPLALPVAGAQAFPTYHVLTLDCSETDVVMDPVRPYLYASDKDAKKLMVYDINTLSVVKEFSFSYQPESIAIKPTNDLLYVALLTRPHNYTWWDSDGHEGYIAEIDLDTLEILRTFWINEDPYDIVVTSDSHLYVSSGSGQWSYIRGYDIATASNISSVSNVRAMSTIELCPGEQYIFAADTDQSPSDFRKFQISAGTITSLGDSPYHGEYGIGHLFLSPDGQRILVYGGHVFRTDNMQHISAVEAGPIVDAAFDLGSGVFFTLTNRSTLAMSNYATYQMIEEVPLRACGSRVFFKSGELYVIIPQAAPTLTSINPDHGYRWDGSPGSDDISVAITGGHLIGVVSLDFGPQIHWSNLIVKSDAELTVDIYIESSAGLGPRDVSVTTAGGESNKLQFTVLSSKPAPAIAYLSPNSGHQGESLELSIAGANLSGFTSVHFGPGIVQRYTLATDSLIRVGVDIDFLASPGVRNVTVTTPGGTSDAAQFTVLPYLPYADTSMTTHVAQLRQLGIQPVPVRSMSRDELEELLAEGFEAQRDEIGTTQDLYVLLDFLDGGQSLLDILVETNTSEILGFYDPTSNGLYVIGELDASDPTVKLTLAHEYAHAIQDQHFDLLAAQEGDDSEASAAMDALIEGDATLVMAAYYYGFLNPAEQREVSDAPSGPAADVPPVIEETMNFPYLYGILFVSELYSSGGWAAVNAAYADPPKSTEQIMHPEKYYGTRDDPALVTLPDAAATLGTGWAEMDSDVFGEFGLKLYLQEFLGSAEADQAAAGWGGDHYSFLKDSTGRKAFVLQTKWDTTNDALEFYNACVSRARKKSGDSSTVATQGGNYASWQSDGDTYRLKLEGNSVLLVIGPDASTLDKLLEEPQIVPETPATDNTPAVPQTPPTPEPVNEPKPTPDREAVNDPQAIDPSASKTYLWVLVGLGTAGLASVCIYGLPRWIDHSRLRT